MNLSKLQKHQNILYFDQQKKISVMSKIQVSWKRQNKELDNDAETNVQLKKQINKQSDMDSLIQNSINDKVYSLKQEAIQLTKKFQNEKYKNLELDTIIRTMKCRMDDERKTQASSVTDSNFENIESLQRKIKKYQYDLEQINTRTNRISSVVHEKKHKISLLRTDRVIDSSIFRNIEKELISSEMQFKKLLIQKIRHQKIYQECFNQYNSLKSKALQYFQTQQVQQKSELNQLEAECQQAAFESKVLNNNKFKELQRNPQYRNTTIQTDLAKQEQNSHFEFRVKKLLMNLNLTNGKEVVYMLHNVDEINDRYFGTLDKTGDEINQLQEEIKKIEKTIEQNSIKFYKPKADLTKTQIDFLNCQKLKKQVQRTQQTAQNQIQSLNKFMVTPKFVQFSKLVEQSDKISNNMDLQTMTEFLKLVESKMSKLNYHQAPKFTQDSVIIKTGRTQREKRDEKLDDVMNRVKIYEQSDKIMKKQEFEEEYRKMIEAGPSNGSRQMLKKKTRKVLI